MHSCRNLLRPKVDSDGQIRHRGLNPGERPAHDRWRCGGRTGVIRASGRCKDQCRLGSYDADPCRRRLKPSLTRPGRPKAGSRPVERQVNDATVGSQDAAQDVDQAWPFGDRPRCSSHASRLEPIPWVSRGARSPVAERPVGGVDEASEAGIGRLRQSESAAELQADESVQHTADEPGRVDGVGTGDAVSGEHIVED